MLLWTHVLVTVMQMSLQLRNLMADRLNLYKSFEVLSKPGAGQAV